MTGAVVYALGGGAGHLARAGAYVRRFFDAGTPVTILHSATARIVEPPPPNVVLVAIASSSAPDAVRELLVAALGTGRQRELVVDTFPGGLGGEVDDRVLASARRTTLVRRYVKPLAYDHYEALAARFDRSVLPYSRRVCEWADDDVTGARHLFSGPLVRSLEVRRGRPARLAVIGDTSRLGAGIVRLFPEDTVFVRGPFRELPPARSYLSLGAGYNVAYELVQLAVPFALVPEDRRYDDQFRRADLLCRSSNVRETLESLLAEAA